MGKRGCMNYGELDTASYGSPVPLIGLYIAVATLVCFFCITFDLVHALIRKNRFVPCKLFPMNAFTMTVLAVATKIPVDMTTPMPRVEDQLSKLTGTAMLCISLGFYLPSLGSMGTAERYGNLTALSMVTITMVVNVCIQMGTGVIFAFTIEHIIILACILMLLLLMWSSALAVKGQTNYFRVWGDEMSEFTDNAMKNLQGLRKLVEKLYIINYGFNPQTLLCQTPHRYSFGLLCGLSSTVVLQAMLRSFALKNMRLCYNGVSDYGWSIPMVIVAQSLTIAVGTFSIIYRSFSPFVISSLSRALETLFGLMLLGPGQELEYLKFKTSSFRFLGKNLSNVFIVVRDFIMDMLVATQNVLYRGTILFSVIPINCVRLCLERIINIIFHEHPVSKPKIDHHSDLDQTWGYRFGTWMKKMGMKDMLRWTNTYKRGRLTHLIPLIVKWPASKSECSLLITELEATRKEMSSKRRSLFREHLNYSNQVLSVLVFSRMLEEILPSSRRESVRQILEAIDESFEIIYYVQQKTSNASSRTDEIVMMAVKDVWAHWDNPNHWLRSKIISPAFKSYSSLKESDLVVDDVRVAFRNFHDTMEGLHYHLLCFDLCFGSLHKGSMHFVEIEVATICEFLQKKEHESVRHLFDYLEMCFVKMLCFILSDLPLAILKEIDGENPIEIGEGRMRKALELLCTLELLEDTQIEWSWPTNFKPKYQTKYDLSPTVASDSVSVVEAQVSNVIDGKVGNSNASLATAVVATSTAEDDDDGDTILEIGTNEIV